LQFGKRAFLLAVCQQDLKNVGKENARFQARSKVLLRPKIGRFLAKLVIPAGFEPTACRLGDQSISRKSVVS